MSRRSPRIKPFAIQTLAEVADAPYDAAIASLGFETRSRQIPEKLGTPHVTAVIPFEDRHELDYAKNKEWFRDHAWTSIAITETEFVEWATTWLRDLCTGGPRPVRVAVDISSMNRPRIGAVIEAMLSLPPNARAEVDLLYAPAIFEAPERGNDPQIFDVAPVSDYFAGWWTDLDAPLIAVIGLGYELEMAASAIDKLEPESTIVFRPDAENHLYAGEVDRANEALMQTRGVMPDPVHYKVADPFSCFCELESTLAKLEPRFRIAMVPLGPKIYAACAMLAAALHSETSQVIRVSAGTHRIAQNRVSNGRLCGLSVLISPPPRQDVEDWC